MNSNLKAPVATWLCSISSVLLCIALLLLAVHGWVLGQPSDTSENFGPYGFQLHLISTGAVALFATWIAGPLWCVLLLFERFRRSPGIHAIQAAIFGVGWLLTFLAMNVLDGSPARFAF